MPSVIKEQDFGPVPISEETLAEYYLNVLNEIEEQYHKLPEVAILDFKFKTSSGEVYFEFPFALSATERTTKEQRKDTFATIIHIMSSQTEWAGLNLHMRLDFKIEPGQ
ncbi:hypothetical protein OAory_01073940 [Aspergillus oryzae]|uniref:Uncharacterized protein n=2 Tax=Aspergillus subgen. Circumdati TaxID=2720871 RepID=A0A1S9DPM2_ASPOZ|nr:hypothetical protein OAory_01073940 [Aspergillus oryzae]RMZ41973.1 hypothetical protein CA14_010555 [Aspergillus flavus]